MGPFMVWVWGNVFKLEVMDHSLQVSADHQSSVMERDMRLFHWHVLAHQPGHHNTSVGRGYGSFRGCRFKLKVIDHALRILDDHHSNVMKQNMRLFLSCVLDQHPGDHITSVGGTSVGRGYRSFGIGVTNSIYYVSYGFETRFDFLMFFEMGPNMV
ncbi:unnamed protein product [Lactuca virosa]|uniref:Dirigent protein n=1 Tax=Lactuca virosa TaxID=75947 RepID=A0AAU9N1B5_9ASTR|nr:unnamed protein product [Lactuca virosa]